MPTPRSVRAAAVLAVAVTALAAAATATAAPLPPRAATASCLPAGSKPLRGDIDGDGIADYAVGGLLPLSDSLSVDVRTSRAAPRVLSVSDVSDRTSSLSFGESTAIGDLDGDGCADLVIADPASDAPASTPYGHVYLVPGSPQGLQLSRVVDLTDGVKDSLFGSSVALGTREVAGARVVDLWVGAGGRSVGSVRDAGAILHYTFTGSLHPTLLQTLTETSPVVGGTAVEEDEFGTSLAAGPYGALAGTPYKDIDGQFSAGEVTYLQMDLTTGLVRSATTWHEGEGGVSGTPEEADLFGDTVAMAPDGSGAAVGAPQEAIGSTVDAGLVQLFAEGSEPGTLVPSVVRTQNSPGVPGRAEPIDHFGSSLAIGEGLLAGGGDAVAVGSMWESIGSVEKSGSVTLLPLPPASGDMTGLPAAVVLAEGSALKVSPHADGVGWSVDVSPRRVSGTEGDVLRIGAPGRGWLSKGTLNAGAVFVVRRHGSTYEGFPQLRSDGPEGGDGYGRNLSTTIAPPAP